MKNTVASLVCPMLLIAGSAINSQGASILFTSTLTGGDLTTQFPLGLSDVVTGLVNIPFNSLVVSGAPLNNGTYTPLFLREDFNTTTHVLTLVGTVNGCATCAALPGLSASSTLVSILLSGDLTANTTTSTSSLNKPPPAQIISITLSSILLADLGLAGSTFELNALTSAGQADSGTGGNYVSAGASLGLISTTPEPASLLTFMLGLVPSVMLSRKTVFRTRNVSID